MIYRTCMGCKSQGAPCEARNIFRKAVAGLGIRSALWHCREKRPRFVPGDLVWAFTVSEQTGGAQRDDDGEPWRDDFPGIVITMLGAKALVFVKPDSPGRTMGDNVQFVSSNNGFCKIPLSRLKSREGEREEICKFCSMPSSLPHESGYSCNPSW